MKNTIDLPSSILRRRGILMRFLSVKMSLSELQRRNLIVNFCLQNSNESKSETFEHFKLLRFKTIYRTIERFAKQEKLVSGKNLPFHRLNFMLP
jgi:hypothetical protein